MERQDMAKRVRVGDDGVYHSLVLLRALRENEQRRCDRKADYQGGVVVRGERAWVSGTDF